MFRMLALTYVNFIFQLELLTFGNALSTNVKYLKSINEFKNQIDKLTQLQDTFYGFDEQDPLLGATDLIQNANIPYNLTLKKKGTLYQTLQSRR